MPAAVLKSLASKAGVSAERAEKLWQKAKKAAADEGKPEDYAYITGIVKQMMGVASEASEDDVDFLLFESGYPVRFIVESVSPSDAASMRTDIQKIVTEITKLGTEEANWSAIALHLKLLLNKWLKASTKERGFFSSMFQKIGLFGESTDDREIVKTLCEAYDVSEQTIREIYNV